MQRKKEPCQRTPTRDRNYLLCLSILQLQLTHVWLLGLKEPSHFFWILPLSQTITATTGNPQSPDTGKAPTTFVLSDMLTPPISISWYTSILKELGYLILLKIYCQIKNPVFLERKLG